MGGAGSIRSASRSAASVFTPSGKSAALAAGSAFASSDTLGDTGDAMSAALAKAKAAGTRRQLTIFCVALLTSAGLWAVHYCVGATLSDAGFWTVAHFVLRLSIVPSVFALTPHWPCEIKLLNLAQMIWLFINRILPGIAHVPMLLNLPHWWNMGCTECWVSIMDAVFSSLVLLSDAWAFLWLLRAMFATSTRTILDAWLFAQVATMVFAGFCGVLYIGSGNVISGSIPPNDIVNYGFNILQVAIAYIISREGFRGQAQEFMARIGFCTSASVVVAMLGSGNSTSEVFAMARDRFRGVPMDRITYAMMEGNRPASALMQITEPMRLGHVDGFLTHSWSDPIAEKWAAMCAWRDKVLQTKQREPTMWIDRFCIDQTDIKGSLMCLPVFLGGCHTLVIAAGETYMTRLWCVMEVFTFLEMGLTAESIDVYPLLDVQCLSQSVATFEAKNARCFLKQDQEHLFSVIEVGFGAQAAFNKVVSRALSTALCNANQNVSAQDPQDAEPDPVEQPLVQELPSSVTAASGGATPAPQKFAEVELDELVVDFEHDCGRGLTCEIFEV